MVPGIRTRRDAFSARERVGRGAYRCRTGELVRVHGLRERRERQRRAERHRDTKRASRARAGDPAGLRDGAFDRASGRAVSQVTPLASRVLNRVRVDDAAREDASPFDEARETVRKMPILPSARLAGDTRARASRMADADARRAARNTRGRAKKSKEPYGTAGMRV